MLTTKFIIGEIDYEKTLTELFPLAYEKLKEADSKNPVLRFFVKMGGEAVPAAIGILQKLDNRTKGEILCSIARLYGQDITLKVNEKFKGDNIGKNISISDIKLTQAGENMELYADEVRVDYQGLLSASSIQKTIGEAAGNKVQLLGGWFRRKAEDYAGPLAKTAAAVMPDETERVALNLLQVVNNKEKLIALLEKALQENGIWMKIQDIQFSKGGMGEVVSGPVVDISEGGKLFTDELEEEILDAVTEYVKSLLLEIRGDYPKTP